MALELRDEPVGGLREGEADLHLGREAHGDAAGEDFGRLGVFLPQRQLPNARRLARFAARVDREGDAHRLVAGRYAAALDADRPVQRFARMRRTQRAAELDPEGAGIFVEHDRLQRGPGRRVAHGGRGHTGAVAQRKRRGAAGEARAADGLEGSGDVHDAAAINGVVPGRPGIERAAQEDVDDLPAGQVGKGLRQQRCGAGHLGSGKAGAGEQVDVSLAIDVERAVLVTAAYPVAAGGKEMIRLIARAVAEIGDRAVLADRAGDDHATSPRRVDACAKGIGICVAVVAGGNDHHCSGGHGIGDGASHDLQRRISAER